MKLYNGNKIEDLKYIESNDGIHYVDKMTEEQLNARGYYKVSFEAKPNRRYYNSTQTSVLVDNVYVVGYDTTPVELAPLKANMTAAVKEVQAAKLTEIDWYWLREQKIGTPVPQEIQDIATSIYSTAETKENEIAALTDVAGCETYENEPYVETVDELDQDGNPTGQTVDVTKYKNNVTDW